MLELLTSTSVSKETETRWNDPLAQTFLVEDSVLEGGVYLTKVDLFFFTKAVFFVRIFKACFAFRYYNHNNVLHNQGLLTISLRSQGENLFLVLRVFI